MKINSVIVRMYRKLLGDCFLIIVESDGKYYKTLVDCGILQGTPKGADWMNKIVDNVYQSFGTKLDLVVVTHEHWDHIAGFHHASGTFARRKFRKLWMAWTENPKDPDGQLLRARFTKGHHKLAALATVTKKPLKMEGPTGGLMGFAGPLSAAKQKDPRPRSEILYDKLRHWSKDGPTYLSPGMIDELPGKLKTYVLAPPRDQKLLFKALPSTREETKETYLGASSTEEERDEIQAQSPFSPTYRWKSYWDVKGRKGKKSDAMNYTHDRYFGAGNAGIDRRIDDRYEMEFNRLAIKMDSNTNNSSLVLAIELPDATTMIFAADAQVGNWLSWGGVKFQEKDSNGQDIETKGHDLLARARLYKVGHHGSHNATLKKDGLELMVRDDLIALISTDAKFARQQGKGWLMPNPRVDEALQKHAPGRVIRGDLLTDEQALKAIVKEGKGELFVDVLVHGAWPADYEEQNAGA